ncbi:hypothetical protein LUZ61_003202 [Rhynchospora tenuis]|uniref:non-specific serine/threonine protein kinase n=1 Tax=Rhynchospora tenuis TaxID=198213 RepID=A0AAD5ZKD0_9POAL|nr:hypothetical protein LUZ61_003202 [Rhynchospora tenuis]
MLIIVLIFDPVQNLPHSQHLFSLSLSLPPLRFEVYTSLILRRRSIHSGPFKMESSSRGGGYPEALVKSYKLGKTLGIGSFGKVKLAEHILTGLRVAIKIIDRRQMKSMEMEEKVKREIKILRLFIHPHVIRLYEVIDTPTHVYVVTEYCKYGELFDYIVEKGRLQEDEARRIFQQIISGVEYCHRNMVVHRDLKPENLLLDSKYNVKLADFGLSNVMRDGHFLKTSCGSPNYAAPEVISGKLYAGPEVDVWSCGVTLYALLCGTLPFDDENIPNLFKKIKSGIYTLPSHLSALARDLIPRMLVVDPMKRITIREIREHAWFQTRLPHYLAVPPPDTAIQAKKIDEEVLEQVIKMGFDKIELVESLSSRRQNEATVTYYLLLDSRLRATSGYLGADFQEPKDSSNHNSYGLTPHGSMDPQSMAPKPHYVVERKWALGLQLACRDHMEDSLMQRTEATQIKCSSRAHPREIMVEVLRALQELDVSWKKNGHYNMKCKWSIGTPQPDMVTHTDYNFADEYELIGNGNVTGRSYTEVKFEIQLYRTREEKYFLDLQRLSGPHLLFLDLCAAFLSKLRVI